MRVCIVLVAYECKVSVMQVVFLKSVTAEAQRVRRPFQYSQLPMVENVDQSVGLDRCKGHVGSVL